MNKYFSLLLVLYFSISPLFAKSICLTFDDIPGHDSDLMSRSRRVQAVIHALEQSQIQAVFFAIGNDARTREGKEITQFINDHGHLIGNHSNMHLHASSESFETFKQELLVCEEICGDLKNYKKWFRFPFLDYGNRPALGGSEVKRRQIADFLSRQGYIDARVTVNTLDWYIDKVILHEHKQKRVINKKALGEAYTFLIMTWIDYYDKIYTQLLGNSPTHTLLLHLNDLNALFLPQIIDALKKNGWEIASPEYAYSQDWIFHPQTLAERYQVHFGPNMKPPYLSIKEIDELLNIRAVFSPN